MCKWLKHLNDDSASVVTGLSPTVPSHGWTPAHPEDTGPTIAANHLEGVFPRLEDE